MGCIDVTEFIKEYDEILLEEHREIVYKYHREYNDLVKSGESTSTHGTHYNKCSWSKNEARDGPDTCRCQHIHFEFNIVAKLISFYKRIINKK